MSARRGDSDRRRRSQTKKEKIKKEIKWKSLYYYCY